ncbi:acyl-CoA dehydrogenase family protein [bacterium]|nr:acyl-CoA dehydrogenase family protein [bacterium]
MDSSFPDFLNLEERYTPIEKGVRKAARAFVQKEIEPIIADAFLKGEFPTSIIPKVASLGFLGPTLPKKYGGMDLGDIAYGLMLQELEAGDSGIRSFVSVQGALCMYPIFRYGSEEQRMRWLPQMAKGELIGCFGLTEPDAGSDPGGMSTTAKPTEKGWEISGRKMWITNGTLADLAVVWAKHSETDEVLGFVLEKGMEGFSAPEMEGKLSLRASVTSELVMDKVQVPDANRLPTAQGLGAPLSCLTQARFGIAWGTLGLAIDCYREALQYTKEREQFGRPIAGFQLTQAKLVQLLCDITGAQGMLYHMGKAKEAGTLTHQQVSMAKRVCCELGIRAAREARSMLGGSGILADFHCQRHSMNMESVITYEGTHEVHTLILGREITGLNAFS